MFEDDALQNIADSDISTILDYMKPLFPRSIHAYYFIDCLLRWKQKVPSADIGILSPKGGHKSGAVFFYYIVFNQLEFSFYVWTKEGSEALQRSLLATKRFQWKDYKYITIPCLSSEMFAVIEPVLPKLLKDRLPARIGHEKVFWLTKDEVAKFEVKVSEGMNLGELKKEHATIINSVWPYRNESSEKFIEMMMWVNFGRGLFNADGQLVAWAFYWVYGALGIVQTAENERRRNYGKVVVQAVCKEMASLGLDVHLIIVEGNTVSEAFFRSLGFRHGFDSVWVFSALERK